MKTDKLKGRLEYIRLGDILPNPYDDTKRFPLDEAHVARLAESMGTTGPIPNIPCRQRDDGKVEAACGRHRLKAAEQKFGTDALMPVIICDDLDPESYISIWSRENITQRGQDALMWQQVIRGVLKAAADGSITLPEPKGKQGGRGRPARFFPNIGEKSLPYTADTIARFIGATKGGAGEAMNKVSDALTQIDLIDSGVLRQDQFIGLTMQKAGLLVKETLAVKRELEETAKALRARAAENEKRVPKLQAEAKKIRDPEERAEAMQFAIDVKAEAGKLALMAEDAEKASVTVAKKVAEAVSTAITEGGAGRRRTPMIAQEVAATAREEVLTDKKVQKIVEAAITPPVKPKVETKADALRAEMDGFARKVLFFLDADVNERVNLINALAQHPTLMTPGTAFKILEAFDALAHAGEALAKRAKHFRAEWKSVADKSEAPFKKNGKYRSIAEMVSPEESRREHKAIGVDERRSLPATTNGATD